jgi:mannose/cellobiose epimerase-like protein (N-acyl-D-glucosamine 2-epimerase family)
MPPNFRDPANLRNHIAHTMDFYHPRAIDPAGGFFHFFRDDGTVYDAQTRHLVSSTRFVVNFSRCAVAFKRPDFLDAARHGLVFLQTRHLQPQTGGFAWLLRDGEVVDGTNHGYGLAFVLLAAAEAIRAGIADARPLLDHALALLEQRFDLPSTALIADEWNADFSICSPYRGQNANMHLCEALIAVHQATGDARHLQRAIAITETVTGTLAAQGDGFVWEHYDEHWRIDWNFNRNDPKHLFRPWGFQPGHQIEWAKLLLTLHVLRPTPAWVARAQSLFDRSMEIAWDSEHGGIFYGFAPDGSICDDDKYFWVQAEAIACAARLAEATGESKYWDQYNQLWQYAWTHFVDHKHGAWYRILDRRNTKYSDEKSPAGKVDYHTVGATLEAIDVLERLTKGRV